MTTTSSAKWSTQRLVAVCITGALASVVVFGVLFILVWFRSWSVPSQAMEPTVHMGTHVWSRSVDRDHVNRDDIVILVPPGKKQTVITRVVAVGGDSIESAQGRLVLNGTPLDERFLATGMRTPTFPTKNVPTGTVFVLGDNRTNSAGSQLFGPVPLTNIQARVVKTDAPAQTLLLLLAAVAIVPVLIALFGGRGNRR